MFSVYSVFKLGVSIFQKVDKLSLTLLEKTSALNEMNVAHQTLQAQLQGKSSEMENLLQQNREVSVLSQSLLIGGRVV